jgi:hypothetical protein
MVALDSLWLLCESLVAMESHWLLWKVIKCLRPLKASMVALDSLWLLLEVI